MLKLLNSVLMLVILCEGIQSLNGEALQCEFKNKHLIHSLGNVYSCSVSALDNPNDNKIITGYSGNHQSNKYDRDVKQIYILDTYTKYIPAGLGSLSELAALIIQRSELIEIRSKDFQGMQNLEYLHLSSNKLTSVPSVAFSSMKNLKFINLNYNQIKYIGSGAFDQLTNLDQVHLRSNFCVNEYYIGATKITQMKEDLKVNCDPLEKVISYENKNGELMKEKDALIINRDALKKELNNITKDLTTKLPNCEANQQKSMEFNLTCDFKMTNGVQYICETRDLTIHQKEMKLNEVIGNHLRSKSNQEVTELIIEKSSMFYWSKDIFTKFPALQILKIQNAQLNELKRGDFSSASELRVLVVNGNNIKPLSDDVFHGTEEHLTEINLNSNQIEKISAGTFHGLKQLKVLSLQDNLITEIPFGSFKDIVMLEILILTGNKIKFLDGKMLQFNKRLMTLAVDQNELREVGEEILDYSKMLKDVNFGGNYCIDERTGIDDDDTDGRTLNDLIFVIRNCCKNSAEGLNAYYCGQSGSED